MKNIKAFLQIVLVVCLLITTLPVSAAEKNLNPATDWLSEAIYGVDGPSPRVYVTDSQNWEEQYNEYDVEYAVQVAADAGAAFMQVNVVSGFGYLLAPNPVFDQITGREAGERTSKRDFIEEYYQALNKRGMKLMLYFNIDGPYLETNDYQAMGGTWHANSTFDEKWGSVAKYWSEKYGEKIAGWWIDGAYSNTGYTDPAVLEHWSKMLKAGNPDSLIAYNTGIKPEVEWNPEYGIGDFFAGENYGINMTVQKTKIGEGQLNRYVPTSRWLEGQQWHRYLPLSEYCTEGSAYSINDLVEYMLEVKKHGGAITFGVSSTGGGKVDPIQQEVLAALKKYVRDGEPLPEPSYDGSKPIQAGTCTTMSNVGTLQPTLSMSPFLYSTGAPGGGIKWHISDSIPFWFPIEPYQKGSHMELWAQFDNVTIPEGTKYVGISVKEPDANWMKFEHRLELRLGSKEAEAFATVENVGYVDSFRFSDHPITDSAVPGYRMVNIEVDIPSGVNNIHMANVLRDGKKPQSAFKPIKAANAFCAPNGKIEIQITEAYTTPVVGSLDGNDTLCYPNIDFGEKGAVQFIASMAVGTDWAGQILELYIDAPNEEEGKHIGSLVVGDTQGWNNYREHCTTIEKVTGIHDFYVIANGFEGIGNFNEFQFSERAIMPDYSTQAQALYDLGIYKGISHTEFVPDLKTSLDRQTGVVMLVRMFGKEKDAFAMNDDEVDSILSVFKDKDDIVIWAKPHIAYAVKHGIIQGIGSNEFAPKDPLLGKDYCTLILRQLGYSVSGEDYDRAAQILSGKGELSASDAELLNNTELSKNEMVGITFYGLYTKNSNDEIPIEKLKEDSEDTDNAVNPDGKYTIVAIGDSITNDPNYEKRNYSVHLKELMDDSAVVYNCGMSGTAVNDTVPESYRKTAHDKYEASLEHLAEMYIIMLGTNDSRLWKSKEAFYNEYKKLVEEYENLESSPEIILVTPPTVHPSDVWKDFFDNSLIAGDIRDVINQIGKEKLLTVIDMNTLTSDKPNLFHDGVHPNEKGAIFIAEQIYSEISDKIGAVSK